MHELQTRDVVLRILLTIVTCGLYGLYWMKTLTDDIHRFSGRPQTPSGGMVALLTIITCSLYFYYWLYKISGELIEARQEKGLPLDAVSNATYTVTVVITSLLAVLLSSLQSMGEIPEDVYQDLSDIETLVAGLIAFAIVGSFWLIFHTFIAAVLLWFVYRRKEQSPRIVYMLLALFRIQILTAAFLQASLNDAITSPPARTPLPTTGTAGDLSSTTP